MSEPINPWASPETAEPYPEWEDLAVDETPSVRRLRVPGGWLYLVGKFPPTYVPDAGR